MRTTQANMKVYLLSNEDIDKTNKFTTIAQQNLIRQLHLEDPLSFEELNYVLEQMVNDTFEIRCEDGSKFSREVFLKWKEKRMECVNLYIYQNRKIPDTFSVQVISRL